jgi:hypothetical protein
MKNVLIFLLFIGVFITPIHYKNQIRSGWVGPNASIKFNDVILSDLISNIVLPVDSVIIFDDYSYLFIKNFPNKKMPITYVKLYADRIPNLVASNLAGMNAIALTRVEFINELSALKNQFLDINIIRCLPSNIGMYCITNIQEKSN